MKRLTLGQVFVLATAAAAVIIAVGLASFVRSAHHVMLQSARRQNELEARHVETRVLNELERARRVLDDVERSIRAGAVNVDAPAHLEPALFMAMLDDARLEEVAFTRAALRGWKADGEPILAPPTPETHWQLSLYREADGGIDTRTTKPTDGAFASVSRRRTPGAHIESGATSTPEQANDPAAHDTFSVIAAKQRVGQAIWSDLHWSELDQLRKPGERRLVLTVQKAIQDEKGKFLGVLRVGVETRELDAITRDDPDHRVVLAAARDDKKGIGLVARVDPSDHVELLENRDLRFVSDHPPPEVAALFDSALVKGLDPEKPSADGDLVNSGRTWLTTIRPLELGRGGTAGWLVAILVPEDHYTQDLVAIERRLLVAFCVVLTAILAIGALTLGAVRRGLARVVAQTSKMRSFDFEPAHDASVFRDVEDVMTGLERAKTVVRAMGKYVPIDLVRRLYETNEEPRLGGELDDVSLMFTDIEGFTSLSEKLAPDALAEKLGEYLEAMTVAIESTGGTIDKYIGDAVMAIWNAPTHVDGHPKRACRAALACMEAAKKLYASPSWNGLPALVTRFGLHRARVMVGHFGAPTRLSYTALGDGVNLAARLEPLCKQYGVVALASEAIVESAGDEFVFRRIDRVAVKGKTQGIDVYELLGRRGEALPQLERCRLYERAFDAYLARDFDRALALLEPQVREDPPSAVLADRCRVMRDAPPPVDWAGIHVARSK